MTKPEEDDMRFMIVKRATTTDGTPLCQTCRWATFVRGPPFGNEIVSCARVSDDRITFPVVSCTSYSDRSLTSLRDMEDVVWILRSDARRKEIGFVRARDLKPRERYVLDDDWTWLAAAAVAQPRAKTRGHGVVAEAYPSRPVDLGGRRSRCRHATAGWNRPLFEPRRSQASWAKRLIAPEGA